MQDHRLLVDTNHRLTSESGLSYNPRTSSMRAMYSSSNFATVAVGTVMPLTAPRTDPYERNYRIRLLFRMNGVKTYSG